MTNDTTTQHAARYAEERLRSGRPPEEVKQHLMLVGWPENEAAKAVADALVALGAPRPPEYAHTAGGGAGRLASTVEVVLNFFSFILLATIAISLGVLCYQIINKFFPDPLLLRAYGGYQGFSTDAIHYAIATLIIAFPIYAATIFFWFKRFREDEEKIESKLTKWLTYLVLLVAAVTIVGDLIAALFYFLQGELTMRFFLKALVIFAIAGTIFGFYFLERRKIQYKKPIERKTFQTFGWAVSSFIVIVIILGFVASGSPATERKRSFDAQRAADLRTIANCIADYGYYRKKLPDTLDDLSGSSQYAYCALRTTDPETGTPYEYRIVTPMKREGLVVVGEFELCAVFSLAASEKDATAGYGGFSDKWHDHPGGRACDTEIVTLDRGDTVLPGAVPAVPS